MRITKSIEELLFEILESLNELKGSVSGMKEDSQVVKVGDSEVTITKNVDTKLDCKYCGGKHENRGQILSCAKKNKKKG